HSGPRASTVNSPATNGPSICSKPQSPISASAGLPPSEFAANAEQPASNAIQQVRSADLTSSPRSQQRSPPPWARWRRSTVQDTMLLDRLQQFRAVWILSDVR